MRRFLIAGNWKMNCGPSDAAELLEGLKEKKVEISEDVDVLVFPPSVSISMSVSYLHDTDIQVGAQNFYYEENGAYTGEVSASMLTEAGCSYVLIGHSERREYFGETDESVNKKIHKAIDHNLGPIVCVGESLGQRKEGIHFDLVKDQITAAFANINEIDALDVVVAYEPIWAIGTGETASPEQAQEMHAHIRSVIAGLYDQDTADGIRILYGGSMKPGNAEELLGQADVDGGLIGGASLDTDGFAQIITTAEKLS